jgi:flagellar basal body rod protein FlgF
MVKMIEYSRSFEANTKMMKVAEELDQAASKLLSQS